jgi:malonate transporter MadL subunit
LTIYGVALLAVCTLAGAILGDWLGQALHVKANVGGVGIAMMLLIAARWAMERKSKLPEKTRLGVEFWALMYIPIVVAMAATQNVVAAVKGGPIVVIAATLTVLLCFLCVWAIGAMGGRATRESREHFHAGDAP